MRLNKISFILLTCCTALSANATDTQKEIELLKQQLKAINEKLLVLEQKSKAKEAPPVKVPEVKDTQQPASKEFKSKKNIQVYASLRPTFGYIDENGDEAWDVRDALSNAGFKSVFNFKEGWEATMHGEWGIDISNNADFGKARQVYVALESPIGRFAIGKQRPVQYTLIAEYVDIFNHSRSPFAYDQEGPFFVSNLVTYQKKLSDFTFMLAGQFDGESGSNNEDFFNGGVSYDVNNLHIGLTYSAKDIYENNDTNLGKDKIYAASLAYTFGNDLYIAMAYQDVEYERRFLSDRDGETIDLSLAYPLGRYFKMKTGVFKFEDGYNQLLTRDHDGANITFEWLPADSLRFHIEYLYRDFERLDDFSSISVGFRYDYSKLWQF